MRKEREVDDEEEAWVCRLLRLPHRMKELPPPPPPQPTPPLPTPSTDQPRIVCVSETLRLLSSGVSAATDFTLPIEPDCLEHSNYDFLDF